MSDDFVRVDRREDGVAVIRLDRPKMNALSGELLRQLAAAVDDLAADPPGAVVVWGGDRIFAAGADVSEFGSVGARTVGGLFRTALDKLAALPRVTIAAVNGYALGGGCELALACDLRVVSEDAKLGQPEVLLGIIPGGGGSQRLARLVGPAVAKDVLCSGRQVAAEEALRIGLANRVAPAAETFEQAAAWAAQFAAGALTAQAMCKRLVDDGLDGELADGLSLEQDLFVEVFETDDASIGVASFLEHGPGRAVFTGR